MKKFLLLLKMKTNRGFFVLIFLLLTFSTSAGDSIKSPVFFSVNYRGGQNKPHRTVVENLVYPYRSVDFKLGWQTLGNKAWHSAYRNPSFGVGFNYASFDTEIVGKPVAFYFFTQFPQYNATWGRLDLEVDCGLAYGINPYNADTNPYNFSTGSSTNVFFGFYLEQSFNIGKHVDVFAAGGFTHYSNGALDWPNLGLNIPSVKVGLRYQPNESKAYYTRPEFERKFSISTYVGGGTMFVFSKDTLTYNSGLVQPSLNYRIGYKHRVGIGYELSYNESYRIHWDPIIQNTPGRELWFHAIFASHEFLIERFTIHTQLGLYIGKHPVRDKVYYERIGIGYYITPWWRAVLNLKAHYIKAEYVELGFVFDVNL
jgi:hypothetical protein